MENHRETYRLEAYELLTELEASLLELEETPEDRELVGRVFRALHTIKGSGAMFGFDDIADFTHEIEAVFDLVRDGKITVTKDLVNLALAARDHIKGMLDQAEGEGAAEEAERSARLIEAARELTAAERGEAAPAAARAAEEDEVLFTPRTATYRIRIKPPKNLFLTGANPILLLNELRELGDARIIAQTDAVPRLAEYDPEACYTYWDVVLTTRRPVQDIRDVFIFVEDICKITIDLLDEDGELDTEENLKRLGEILVERGDIASDAIMDALTRQKRIGQVLVEADIVKPGIVESALAEQEHVKSVKRARQESAAASSIRVPAEKLDILVDLVGELVTVQARLSQKAGASADSELVLIAEEVERLTAELRNNTMSIRMLPIGTTFAKFKRLVRDLSQSLGKEVILLAEGGETELDKTVIEQLNDPMVHIIRNCIDHGVENPDIRQAMGKPRQGTIRLSAAHSGANVIIEIADDGAGLDAEKIRAKAVEKGLIAQDAELSKEEIFALTLSAGFSTARDVTDVSGRGVGMDVVKRAIETLHGAVDIRSLEDEGTTISLKLPLTLAIIDGLLVRIGEDCFVFPLSVVEECLELTGRELDRARSRNMIDYRGNVVPYLCLREVFRTEGARPDQEQVIISDNQGDKVGFGVDRVVGQIQTVIKSLGKMYKDMEGISGATILGDGSVALIMDVNRLIRSVENLEMGRERAAAEQ